MKKYSFLLLAAFFSLFAVSTFAQKATTDIFGYYTIVKPTKDFADIFIIHLGGNYGAQQKPSFYGLVRLKKKSAKDFYLLKPTLNGKNLTFTTEQVG